MQDGSLAAATSPKAGETEMEKMRREFAELKAELAKQAGAQAGASQEAELRKEIAQLRAAAASNTPVAEHMAREALYKREPYKATLDRQRAKLEGFGNTVIDKAEPAGS